VRNFERKTRNEEFFKKLKQNAELMKIDFVLNRIDETRSFVKKKRESPETLPANRDLLLKKLKDNDLLNLRNKRDWN
jgi:CO dehydrogenase nickel-insertion accessory protein CooC1